MSNTKYCKHCGEQIDVECIICPKCGKQVETLHQENNSPIIINNNASASSSSSAAATNTDAYPFRICNKWVAFFLALFLGYFGAHKFYEGKTGIGLLYLFTFGLAGIGWFIDVICILLKPSQYPAR